jgi:signal recognition particle subunit SRP54
MAGRILGMGDVVGLVEKAQSAISEKEAQASFEKMVLGDFTLEDMLGQLRMIRKLGPLKKVLGMMPGIGAQAEALDIDDKQMNRLEALFTSMTPRERLQPDVIDMSRRRRIARGSGQEVPAVNDLLKRHREMKLLMKQLNKMGLASQFGGKQKEAALKSMSGTGELASGGSGGGLLGGLGGLGKGIGGLFGAGGGGGAAGVPGLPPGGFPGLGGGGNPFGPRPMGSSHTRKSGKKKKDKKRRR